MKFIKLLYSKFVILPLGIGEFGEFGKSVLDNVQKSVYKQHTLKANIKK